MGAVLQAFLAKGVRFEVRDGQQLKAVGTLTDALRAEIRTLKPSIIAELSAPESLASLVELDALIDEYCDLAFKDEGARESKRKALRDRRRRLALDSVVVELAEFRALVNEVRRETAQQAKTTKRRRTRET